MVNKQLTVNNLGEQANVFTKSDVRTGSVLDETQTGYLPETNHTLYLPSN